jgi:dipeptidyl aminopeptidase/acylaminoacyl peptidase
MDKDKFEKKIYLVSEENKIKKFTFGEQNDSNPQLSPDGEQIIFISNRNSELNEDKSNQPWIISSKGGEAHPLCKIPGNLLTGSNTPISIWSTKGEKCMFLSEIQSNNEDLLISKLDYKKDGVGLINNKKTHLFIIDKKIKEISETINIEYPIWYDEDSVIYAINSDEKDVCTLYKDIIKLNLKDDKKKKLLKIKTRNPIISISPDKKYIAYLATPESNKPYFEYQYSDIFIKSLSGADVINLTKDFDKQISGPLKWSKDSEYIYFIALDKACKRIFSVTLNTTIKQITEKNISVNEFDINNNSLVYIGCTDTTLSEIYIQNEDSEIITNITNENIIDFKIVQPEEFWFKASDGVNVQGWILRPTNLMNGNKYPTILQIHGGRWGNYNYHLNLLYQTLCNNGYAVVTINHRGST